VSHTLVSVWLLRMLWHSHHVKPCEAAHIKACVMVSWRLFVHMAMTAHEQHGGHGLRKEHIKRTRAAGRRHRHSRGRRRRVDRRRCWRHVLLDQLRNSCAARSCAAMSLSCVCDAFSVANTQISLQARFAGCVANRGS